MTTNTPAQWNRKLFLGSWVPGRGELVSVTEPATGNQLPESVTLQASILRKAPSALTGAITWSKAG